MNAIHKSGFVRHKKVSTIISLGINPSKGGIPPKLRTGIIRFGVTICPLGWRVFILILLNRKITVTTTVE